MSFELPAPPSLALVLGFIGLSLFMVGFWVLVIQRVHSRRAALISGSIMAAWMTTTALAASSGRLAKFDAIPPPIAMVLVPMLLLVIFAAASSVGHRLSKLPLALLVGLHVFRLPVELLIHSAVAEGVAPELMTWSGRNWDVLTPIVAIIFAVLIHKGAPARLLAFVFNLLGLALLANVVTTAILAMPTPFRVFATQPPNVWVAHFPFIWLPAVLVASALFGHLLIGRALRSAS